VVALRVRPVVAAVLLLAGACVAPPPRPPVDAAGLAARLPPALASFERGATLPLPPGFEVAYATPGPVGAAATIEIGAVDPAAPDGPDNASLAALLAEATRAAPHRRLAERGRVTVPPTPPPLLACASLEGRLGRERVEQLHCAGTVAGAPIRLRLAMPWRDPPFVDAPGFAAAAVAALASR